LSDTQLGGAGYLVLGIGYWVLGIGVGRKSAQNFYIFSIVKNKNRKKFPYAST